MTYVSTGSVRTVDPSTSHEAAAKVNANELETLVLAELERAGVVGLTAFEVANNRRMNLNTISPRFARLVAKGLVVDSGQRRQSLQSKRHVIVWQITPLGIATLPTM